MTKIRLARTGATHQPHYRIVVTDSRNRRDGRFIEILGAYHPIQGGEVTVNQERAAYWISVGAQPSNTVIGLLTRGGVKHDFSVRRKPQRTKAVTEEVAAAKPAETAEAIEEVVAVEKSDEMVEEQPLSDQAAEAESETPSQPEAVETAEESAE
jgi:small subunit ribosomal protein S16